MKIILSLALALLTLETHAIVRIWEGDSNARFNDPGNWSPFGVPQAQDDLVFPSGAARTTISNDMTGLIVRSLTFDSGYYVQGNIVTISNGITCSQSGQNVVLEIPIVVGADQTFLTADDDLLLTRSISVNGKTLRLDPAKATIGIFISGSITGTGTIVVDSSALVSTNASVAFEGTFGNTFSGKVEVKGTRLFLDKDTGVAINGPLEVGAGWRHGRVLLGSDDQINPNVPVLVGVDSQLLLQGHVQKLNDLTLEGGVVDTGAASGHLELGGSLRSVTNGLVQTAFIYGNVLATISADQTFPIFDVEAGASPPLDIRANIGGVGFWKNGPGILRLSGTNTFAGDLVVNEGHVEAGNPTAFGSDLVGTTLRGGGLRLIGITISNEALIVEGDRVQLTGVRGSSIINSGLGRWTGPVTLYSNLFVFADDMRFSGPISGAGGIDTFFGTVTFLGDTANTFTGTLRALGTLTVFAKAFNTLTSARGPIEVGGATPFPVCEVRWQAPSQSAIKPVVIHTNGYLNLNGFDQQIESLDFHGGRVSTGFGELFVQTDVMTHPTNFTALCTGALRLLNFGGPNVTVGDGPVNVDFDLRAMVRTLNLRKNGPGLLYVDNINTNLSDTQIEDGIIQANHPQALGGGSASVHVNTGGTLRLGPDLLPFSARLVLAGSGYQGLGALTAIGAPTQTNTVELVSPATVYVDSPWLLNMDGAIGGSHPLITLTKTGDGTLSLGGPSPNTQNSDTIVREGTLRLNKNPGLDAVPRNLVISQGGFGSLAAVAQHRQDNQIAGSVIVNRNGLLDLNGFGESIRELTLNEGGDVQTGAGILFLLDPESLSVNPGLSSLSSTISGQLSASGLTNRWNINPIVTGFDDIELEIPAKVYGTFAIDKHGAGRMRLSGSNVFGSALNIHEGAVIAMNNAALGSTSNPTRVQSNGVLIIQNGIATSEPILLNSTAVPSLLSQSGSNVCSGTITLWGSSSISVASGFLQVLGACDGFGDLTKFGSGTLQFWGNTANTYAGLTIVKQGVLEGGRVNQPSIPGHAVIGDNTTNFVTARIRSLRERQFNPTAEVTVNNSGSLDITPAHLNQNMPPAHETLRALRGTGFVAIGISNSLTFSNEAPFEFSGFIGGAGALNKRGNGSVTMSGNGLFTGPTTVFQGDYIVHGNFLNSPISVSTASFDGVAARLAGDGFVNSVDVGAFSTIAPTSEVPGQLGGELEVANFNLSFFGGIELDFFGPHATGGNDRLVASGNVFLNGGSLYPNFRYAPREGDVLTVLRKLSAGAIPDAFSGWAEGGTRVVNGIPVQISYTGGDSNDITLTVTNLAAAATNTQVLSGNGNGLIEPNECNLLFLGVRNQRNVPIVLSNAILRSITSGAFVSVAQATYPTIPALGTATNLTPFQLRTTTNFPCNSPVVLELEVTVTNEGRFAIPFTLAGGTNCNAGGGGCESCHFVASGQITNGLPTMTNLFAQTSASSICYPPKPCPGPESLSTGAVRYVTHRFTNNSPADLCVTALLQTPCTNALQSLHAAAYRTEFNPVKFCDDYLGDAPTPGVPFSFTVPRFSTFEMVVCESSPDGACASYTLELFGLPCPAPTLDITQDATPGKVIVDWSTAYPGWRLQSVNSLTPPLFFVDAPGTPAIIDSRFTITNVAVGSNRFYRLIR